MSKRIRKYKEHGSQVAINAFLLRMELIKNDESEVAEVIISYIKSYPKLSKNLSDAIKQHYPQYESIFFKYSILI